MLATLKALQDDEELGISPVQQGCIDTLEQGYNFLNFLNDEQYVYVASPHVASSIGQHFRHLLDMFLALSNDTPVIDYNLRRRGHKVETSRQVAMAELLAFIKWLTSKTLKDLQSPVTIWTEVSVIDTQTCEMTSTLERELTFAALHANHHFAMSKVTISLLDGHLNGVGDDFGFAPATLTYLKGQ
ncbi:hypothetical protein [Marinomonas transparens]|uniref:DinB family protein n=1 Tax=Marinomonas transparens TaxID=2795388 RepID=A0A934N008_9GAMM|nr:hypothetical protein [Marinomonas transparens]MBJ7536227.1 hypothetical protein [Marinomonas transparens]